MIECQKSNSSWDFDISNLLEVEKEGYPINVLFGFLTSPYDVGSQDPLVYGKVKFLLDETVKTVLSFVR